MARRALAAPFASPPQALAPFVPARRALQPDPLGRTVGDLRRLQVAVLGGVPKVQDARVQALGAIEALQRQPPAAVRASGIAERPRPHGQLPTVAALAAPPHSGRIAARDVGRLEGPVPLPVPLRQQIRMPEPQAPLLEADVELRLLQKARPLDAGLAVPEGVARAPIGGVQRPGLLHQRIKGGQQFGPAVLFQPLSGILPPDARHHAVPQVNLAVARDAHRVGRQVPVLHGMPERGELGAQRRDVVESLEGLPAGAVRAEGAVSAVDPFGNRRPPLVTAPAEPPHLLLEVGEDRARGQRVPRRMPLLGDVRPHRSQIVLAWDQRDVRAGQAVIEGAARSPGGRLHPLEPAVGASPMDWPARTANAVVRALAAVGIVVPLPKNPRAATLLAPDVKRLEPVGVHARQPLERLGAVLPARMPCDALPPVGGVDLDGVLGDAHGDLAVGIARRHAVEVAAHPHHAVEGDADLSPGDGRELGLRQRLQAFTLLRLENLVPAATLECHDGPVVVDLQQLGNGQIELAEAREPHLLQHAGNAVGHDAHMALHGRLVGGRTDPCGQDHGAVVIR